MIGTVKAWMSRGAYGFVKVAGHPDVFLHVSELRRTGDAAPPAPGDTVEFWVADEERGPAARDARIVKRAAEATPR